MHYISLIMSSNQIQRIRTERGKTQQEAATEADISMSYLAKLERGESDPTIAVARRLAEVLGATVDELWPARLPAAVNES
jgi:transcriptional regulator with XRE-family HTH domain